MSRLLAFIREWLWPRLPEEVAVWRVDRDGRVYLPERRVVLRAKKHA